MPLKAYKPITDFLIALDAEGAPIQETDIVSKLHARVSKTEDGVQEDEFHGAIADLESFRFQPSRGSDRHPW